MKWTSEAEQAIKKVPFFVRKKVRSRVEKEAEDEGKHTVTIAEVQATRNRFLNQMESEIKGFQVEACFGSSGCPHRIGNSESLQNKIETLLKAEDILGFLKSRVAGGLKFHHEFRVTLSDCPNACSQPQIRDIGIIGAALPVITDMKCSHCNQCAEVCQEKAITISPMMDGPAIKAKACVRCGLCIAKCPTGTIAAKSEGYRILLGGKLGRHPRLASELPGIYGEDQVLAIIRRCIDFYKQKNRKGERFGEILEKHPFFLEEIMKNRH
ncbi:MAG: 4Fe-4S dicluster domain-containing protein [Desulfobacterales bacterium]|jgi:dissimilatory sulfite reductase (desulfoviridin) alpha/beta subunit|nr:4Fe-4S dicluster domain-containing protein [Desulfobacterales bacterium]